MWQTSAGAQNHDNIWRNLDLFWCNSGCSDTDLVLLWRRVEGVGQLSVWLDSLCCRTTPVADPLCCDWAWCWWLYWLMWTLWELKQRLSSTSDWSMMDSGVSASGGSEMSSGDAHSYSSLERESSVITSCCWSSASDRPPADASWVKNNQC